MKSWEVKGGQFPVFRVPNCSPLSCHSGISEHLPFAHGLVIGQPKASFSSCSCSCVRLLTMSSKCGAASKASTTLLAVTAPSSQEQARGAFGHLRTHLLDEAVVDAVAAEVRAQTSDRRADGSRLMRRGIKCSLAPRRKRPQTAAASLG
jgi:hypothetical protein